MKRKPESNSGATQVHKPQRELAGPANIQAEIEKLGNKATRMEAITRLEALYAVEGIEPLLNLAWRAKKAERTRVCEALAHIAVFKSESGQVLPVLVGKGLESQHARVRRCAARVLAHMGTAAQPAFQALRKHAEDPSTGVRLEVIRALGKSGDPRAVELLLAFLNDNHPDIRDRAADALGWAVSAGASQDEAASRVRKLLASDQPLPTRIAAVHALGQIGGASAEATLRQMLQDRASPLELGLATLPALQALLGPQVVPLAVTVLEEAGPAPEKIEIRRQAVRCLCDVDTPESTTYLGTLYMDLPHLLEGDGKIRAWVTGELQRRYQQLLGRIRAGDMSVMPALLAVWRTRDRKQPDEVGILSRETMHEISQALVEIGEPGVPALTVALDSQTPGANIIHVLERMGPAAHSAYDVLVTQLDNPDLATACAAARALGAVGDERAAPILVERLSFDENLLAPGDKAKRHLAKKEKKARHRALAMQQAAAIGLGRLSANADAAPRILLSVFEAAHGDDPVARRGAALALGHIDGGRALSALDRLAQDPDPRVREAAVEALAHAERGARATAGDIARLSKLLEDKDERVRAKAVKALGKLSDLRSLDLLLKAYGDPSERVSKAVVRALSRRERNREAHGPSGRSVLIVAAAGGNVSALRALEKHPFPQAIPALIAALDSPWSEVYSAALRTLRTYVQVFAEQEQTREGHEEHEGEQGEPDSAWSLLRRTIPELTYLSHDDSATVRRLALETLGAFRDPGTIPDIAFMLTDEKQNIRFAAVDVLETIGGEDAESVLRAHLEWGAQEKRSVDEELYQEVVATVQRMANSL